MNSELKPLGVRRKLLSDTTSFLCSSGTGCRKNRALQVFKSSAPTSLDSGRIFPIPFSNQVVPRTFPISLEPEFWSKDLRPFRSLWFFQGAWLVRGGLGCVERNETQLYHDIGGIRSSETRSRFVKCQATPPASYLQAPNLLYVSSLTPTWKLENQHVPPQTNSHQNRRDDPSHHLMTLQCFKASQPIHNFNAALEWGEGQSMNPSKLILDYLYACTIIELWGCGSFKAFLEGYKAQNTVQGEHEEQKTTEKAAEKTKRARDVERRKRAEAREETDICDVMNPQALWNFRRMANPALAPTFDEEQLKRQEIMRAEKMDKVREWQQSLAGL
ncbi:hypothetical protein BDP27DRAFT_1450041 [Rhodocollybia butyracea]|uniref:Uncharacterized protein n=1 Tax=Rhodocollybia butyracea TaxID=206335 RepID=A0A9P5PHN7_9AGAR|nr:hypothetical protein BDP27DRAFT_1450041 [Rhodocollybia butyracea]